MMDVTVTMIMMLKTRPLCASAELNLADSVFDSAAAAEKDSFITVPGKGGHSRVVPSKAVCLNPGGLGEELYNNGSGVSC